MTISTYTILAAGWYTDASGVSGHQEAGASIELSAESAGYLLLAGQVEVPAALTEARRSSRPRVQPALGEAEA
jgi:hypothetical protein